MHAIYATPVISIHAPTRGATVHIMPPSADFIISIHAPTRGATGKRSYKKEFQHISIHAPTRGATKYSKTTKITFEISIHAPTRGATVKIILWVSTSTFQSTLPRGERRGGMTSVVSNQKDFNPRSHEGSDSSRKEVYTLIYISIHAPTRGATYDFDDNDQAVYISIHAPTRGATVLWNMRE